MQSNFTKSFFLCTVDYSITLTPTVTTQLLENTLIATSAPQMQEDTETIIIISVVTSVGVVFAVFMLIGLILGYRHLFQKLKGISHYSFVCLLECFVLLTFCTYPLMSLWFSFRV